jgi:multidrug efflux pump subunit AcrA (membrane-fusion protein)
MPMPSQGRPLRRLLPLLAVLVSTGAVGAAEPLLPLSADQLKQSNVAFGKVEAVTTASAGTQSLDSLRLSGRVVVPNSALEVVLAPVAGRVESLPVNPGEVVRAGQALARLYSAELLGLQRELISARTQADLARSRAERDAALHADGIIAGNRLAESEALSASAESHLQEQRQLLRLAGLSGSAVDRIRTAEQIQPSLVVASRRGGTIMRQGISPGQHVDAGDLMFQVASLDTLWLELQATRDQARRLAPGDPAWVAGCAQPARVIATGTQLDAQSQTTMVRAELGRAAGCVAPNQVVEARIDPSPGRDDLLRVPTGSLLQREGRDYVLLREPGGLRPVAVAIERRGSDWAWVHGGLRAGDEVATTGLAALKGAWLGLGTMPEQVQ